ncbi:MAG: hypothetical protein J0653_00690, partial [Deltaproteobacteria bacterium]|nr:hypothetical protein [Deltaproteobacteria bacterium]
GTVIYGTGTSVTIGEGGSYGNSTNVASDDFYHKWDAVTTATGIQALTNKNLTSGTNTFPTFNQNTTGSAAKLTTGRTIGITGPITWTSPTFNGSGNVTAAATVTSQTGTGSKFVMDTSPLLVTPQIGAATATSITTSGTPSGSLGVSKWLTQQETGTIARTYITGTDAATFGQWEIYRSTSTTPVLALTIGSTGAITAAGTIAASGGLTNKAVCWKTGGVMGYCSTVIAVDGSCTCN